MEDGFVKLLRGLILASLLGQASWAATIVNMEFVSDAGGSGVFIFNVNGVPTQLFCDQFLPNATTLPYQANVATLADLTGSFLAVNNDPQALFKYQRVAILNLLALGDMTLAVDVVRASRHIVDGVTPLTPSAQILHDFAMGANAANYDLSGFRIYTNLTTQEVTGFPGGFDLDLETPEPAAFLLIGSGLTAIAFVRRRR
jgi:hypothetical protein